jgi:hypothetical protein
MLKTILTFQTNEKTKKMAKKMAFEKGLSLSEYLRDLLEEDLKIKNNKKSNPWLELAENVKSITSKKEIDEIFEETKKAVLVEVQNLGKAFLN